MTKILVADDETDLEVLIKQKFRKEIRNQEFEFVFAINGKDALEKIEAHPDVEMVLSDINMPEMDGLTFIQILHESKPLIKSVIVSAYGDMDNIRVAMNRGAFDFITKPINFDDLSKTMLKTLDHIKQIKETVRAIRENNIMRMYVDDSVLGFMGSKEFETSLTVNESIEATVAFIDICRFTTISENEKPDKVVNLLNKYFEAIVHEIIANDGYVDKFIGDAVMAVFRGDFHLDRALDACIGARNEIRKLAASTESDISYMPSVSIGLNSGEMISGNIGSSKLRRLDYTVIGNAVNVAQRLQSTADEGQILISDQAYEKVKESFKCKKVGEISAKNMTKKIITYEVLE